MKRLAVLLGLALFLLLPTSLSAAECQFVLGFNTLRDLIGHNIVGECLENEHHNEIGDSVQQTTGGLLVWRKADNWTAFTDGYRTWINGPNGLVQRLNTERFEWEADYAPGGGVATPAPTPIPSATPLPSLIELAKASAWYQDGVDNATEQSTLMLLERIAKNNNSQLARVMSGWDWIFDKDMSWIENYTISNIAELDEKAPELLPYIAQLGETAPEALTWIAELGETAPEFVPYIIELPWIVDGIDLWEGFAVGDLNRNAIYGDPNFARELATAPWVTDGVSGIEAHFGIRSLVELSSLNGLIGTKHASPELARRFMNSLSYPPKETELFLLRSLNAIDRLNPDGFGRLLTEPWFVDGLDEAERIFLIVAPGLNGYELFEPYYIASRSIALPHSGVVNLWIVWRHEPLHGQDELAKLEAAVRGNELFLEVPFPVENVILNLMDPGIRGTFRGSSIAFGIDREATILDYYHEVSHYYFNVGQKWYSEGLPEFMSLYLSSGGNVPKAEFPAYCRVHGIVNLHTWGERYWGDYGSVVPYNCSYDMGLHFLVALRETMGAEAWLSAVKALFHEFYRGGGFNSHTDYTEEGIYRVFMEHTPPHLVDAVRDVYGRLHGGPFVD